MNSIAKIFDGIEISLGKYLKDIQAILIKTSERDVIYVYSKQWNQFRLKSLTIKNLLSCLNNTEINKTTDSYKIAMDTWRDVIWCQLEEKITFSCLILIKDVRYSSINIHKYDLIKQLILSIKQFTYYIDPLESADHGELMGPVPPLYKYFEQKFLEETQEYYQIKSSAILKNNSVISYLKKVVHEITEEENRSRPFLYTTTLQLLTNTLEKVLIRDRLPVINLEAKFLSENKNYEDLSFLFGILKRIKNDANVLQKIVEDDICRFAMTAFENLNQTKINIAKDYVEIIIDIYKQFLKVIEQVFDGEEESIVQCDKTFRAFINNNTITQTYGDSSKSIQLLVQYCDMLLRKQCRNIEEASEIEEKLNEVTIIFKYIEDTDLCQKIYKRMLTKRLISELHISKDHEILMISKLKLIWKYEYTDKLGQMIQDILISKDLTEQYRKYYKNGEFNDILDFSVMVLRSDVWLLSTPPNIILPIELESMFDRFNKFYTAQNTGRRVTILHQYSTGVLETLLIKQKYFLQVSMYQMVVLLLFNKASNWTVEQIQDATQMKLELLLEILCNLLKRKLLVCVEVNEDKFEEQELTESDIRMDHIIKAADDFNSAKVKINLIVPLKSIKQKDNDDLHRIMYEDRLLVIRAAIVRIMKHRQTLEYSSLIEAVKQLDFHFKPKIFIIKKCINQLIEKDYLERKSDEHHVLRYVA